MLKIAEVHGLVEDLVMKILVLYQSNTGNTEKMAELVAEGARCIPDVEVRLRNIDNANASDVLWCDGIALGSPTHMGLLSWKMKRFWDEEMLSHWSKIDGKIGCVFTSSGGWGGGGEIACQSMLTLLMNFGFLVFGVTDYVEKKTTLHYGAVTPKEPRSAVDLDTGRLLGRRLAEWVSVYAGGRMESHPRKPAP